MLEYADFSNPDIEDDFSLYRFLVSLGLIDSSNPEPPLAKYSYMFIRSMPMLPNVGFYDASGARHYIKEVAGDDCIDENGQVIDNDDYFNSYEEAMAHSLPVADFYTEEWTDAAKCVPKHCFVYVKRADGTVVPGICHKKLFYSLLDKHLPDVKEWKCMSVGDLKAN